MNSIQIDGTYTFANTVKTLKIGDVIKLKQNLDNRLNSEAIAAYTTSGNKIGYIPFKLNQIDINAKYIVSKLRLVQGNPILQISCEFDNSSIINCEFPFMKKIKYENVSINKKTQYISELKSFQKMLERNGNDIEQIGITYEDENYVNLLIKSNNNINIFYTVTKKYYDENIFKYDEFYKYKLIPVCLYQPFQIHRLEIYLEKNYKPITNLLKKKSLKTQYLLESLNQTESFLMMQSFSTEFNYRKVLSLVY